MRIKHLYCIDV